LSQAAWFGLYLAELKDKAVAGIMSDMPDKAKVGNTVLRKVPEGKTPEHYLWKKSLEKEWAGEWTLAKLTDYRYKVVLEIPQASL
jgi:hypothetical protein